MVKPLFGTVAFEWVYFFSDGAFEELKSSLCKLLKMGAKVNVTSLSGLNDVKDVKTFEDLLCTIQNRDLLENTLSRMSIYDAELQLVPDKHFDREIFNHVSLFIDKTLMWRVRCIADLTMKNPADFHEAISKLRRGWTELKNTHKKITGWESSDTKFIYLISFKKTKDFHTGNWVKAVEEDVSEIFRFSEGAEISYGASSIRRDLIVVSPGSTFLFVATNPEYSVLRKMRFKAIEEISRRLSVMFLCRKFLVGIEKELVNIGEEVSKQSLSPKVSELNLNELIESRISGIGRLTWTNKMTITLPIVRDFFNETKKGMQIYIKEKRTLKRTLHGFDAYDWMLEPGFNWSFDKVNRKINILKQDIEDQSRFIDSLVESKNIKAQNNLQSALRGYTKWILLLTVILALLGLIQLYIVLT